MIVTCPSCETKFKIPDDKYESGRKARCSSCQFIFVLPEIEPVALEEPAISAASFPAAAQVAEPPADTSGSDAASAEASFPPPVTVEDAVLPPEPAPRKKLAGKKKKILLAVGIFLVLVLLGYGGLLIYSAIFSSSEPTVAERVSDERLTRSLGGRSGDVDPEKEAARQAAVSRLALENVRQYRMLDNEKTGPIVVIEGSVVNNFDTPKDLILLEVTIFDAKGKPLVMREQYCGITLSLLQLRTLTKTALESALSNQVTILTNNTNTPSGMRVPFSTVFFDLPGSAYEFEVKIVDVQDPAPK